MPRTKRTPTELDKDLVKDVIQRNFSDPYNLNIGAKKRANTPGDFMMKAMGLSGTKNQLRMLQKCVQGNVVCSFRLLFFKLPN